MVLPPSAVDTQGAGTRRPWPKTCRPHRLLGTTAGNRPGRGTIDTGGSNAWQISTREEREAVRGPQGQGHVEGARGEDREQPGRVQEGRRALALGQLAVVVVAGRHDRAEEGGRRE